MKLSSLKSSANQALIQASKLLLLAAFVLPSLVPAGFMAQRNIETAALEITLCPSGFSQTAIKALSRPEPAVQHHHDHHAHFAHHFVADSSVSVAAHTDHAGHHEGLSAELCPLAGPGSIIADTTASYELNVTPSLIVYSKQPLMARAAALLPPPVRGPPTLS